VIRISGKGVIRILGTRTLPRHGSANGRGASRTIRFDIRIFGGEDAAVRVLNEGQLLVELVDQTGRNLS
jgi:hypothetical protein